ncbi:hypothetical protein [Myxosarcina sp. GI1]|uniref:hypothetical protein n=1 Tax=Myxosarcina sp. GI1 TaxID=1541065 RepID=UPI0006918DAF|nr:hypothetical protein [Myxosarcina sp. GI1]
MYSSTELLVAAFLSRTLPKPEWTHEAHLRVGLWHLLHYSPGDSLQKLRQSIKEYNVVCGVANTETQGYHETITRFYVWLIDKFVQQIETKRSLDILANELVATEINLFYLNTTAKID